VALLGVAAVAGGMLAMLLLTDYSLEKVLFESISAFALSSRPRLFSDNLRNGPSSGRCC
jgi:hypothetical protein